MIDPIIKRIADDMLCIFCGKRKIDCKQSCEEYKTTLPNNTWQDRFDAQFGVDGPEKDSDSVGHRAGCDDCSENIRQRAKYKSFITSELWSVLEECLPERREPVLNDVNAFMDIGWNSCLDQIIAKAKERGINLNK